MAKINNESFIAPDFGKPAIEALKEILKLTDELQDTFKKVGAEAGKSLEDLNPKESVKDSKALNEILEKLTKTQEQLNELQESKIKITAELKKLEESKLKNDKEALDLAVKDSKVRQEKQKELLAEQKVVKQNLSIAIQRRKERERQFKEREKERKQKGKILTLYQQENKRLKGLIERYRDFSLSNQEGTKEAKALLKEITKTDKALKKLDDKLGQNTRSVGKYTDAVEDLKGGFNALQAIGIVTLLAEVVNLFSQSREGSIEFQKALALITGGFKSLIGSLGNAKIGFSELFSALSVQGKTALASLRLTFAEIKKDFLETAQNLSNFEIFGKQVSAKDFSKNINEATTEVDKLTEELSLLSKQNSDTATGIDKISGAFDDFGAKTEATIDLQIELAKEIQNTEIEVLKLERGLSTLRGEQEKSFAIAEDANNAFKRRREEFAKLEIISRKLAQTEQDISAKKLRLQALEVQADLIAGGVLQNRIDQQANFTEEILKLLSVRENALKVSSTNDTAFTEAYEDNSQKRIEADLFELNVLEKNRTFRSDIAERNLDDFLAFAEDIKAINEGIISDESQSFETRRRTLNATIKLLEDSYAAQKEVVKDFREFVIESDNDLSESEKKRQLEIIENADIDSIVAEKSAIIANQKIRELGLSEIFENRLLEIVKERRIAQDDLRKSSKDLAEAEQEANEIRKEIILQEKALEELSKGNNKEDVKALKELAKAREEQEIKNAEEKLKRLEKEKDERIKLAEEEENAKIALIDKADKEAIAKAEESKKKRIEAIEGESNEELKAQRDLNNLKLKAEEKAISERQEKEEEELEKRLELYEVAISFFKNFLAKQSEENLKALDGQISAEEKSQDRLRALSDAGNEEATKSLAVSLKREKELQREKERELIRQQRIEAGLAAFELLAAKAKDNPKTALPETIKEVLTLTSFVAALPAFFDGTENIGEAMGKPHLNTKQDSYLAFVDSPEMKGLARLDGEERIMTGSQNKVIGDMSNEALTQLVVDSKKGIQTSISMPVVFQQNIDNDKQNAILESILKETKNNSKSLELDAYFNKKTGQMTDVIEYSGAIRKTHKKVFVPTQRAR